MFSTESREDTRKIILYKLFAENWQLAQPRTPYNNFIIGNIYLAARYPSQFQSSNIGGHQG